MASASWLDGGSATTELRQSRSQSTSPSSVQNATNRVNFTDQEKSQILEFLESLKQGVRGPPRSWPTDDKSWSKGTKCG